MFVVGLTGGIGSGKSTVSHFFHELGITIVDADEISREITAVNGCAIDPVKEAFGPSAINSDGSMNRKYIRDLVFSNSAHRERLEQILHPLIQQRSAQELESSQSPYSILSVPLLTEKGFWNQKINRLLVVDIPTELQIERVMNRSALTRAEVESILAAQSPRHKRISMADDIIENVSGLEELKVNVLQLHQFYLSLAAKQSN